MLYQFGQNMFLAGADPAFVPGLRLVPLAAIVEEVKRACAKRNHRCLVRIRNPRRDKHGARKRALDRKLNVFNYRKRSFLPLLRRAPRWIDRDGSSRRGDARKLADRPCPIGFGIVPA
jgi:hypothetical protein